MLLSDSDYIKIQCNYVSLLVSVGKKLTGLESSQLCSNSSIWTHMWRRNLKTYQAKYERPARGWEDSKTLQRKPRIIGLQALSGGRLEWKVKDNIRFIKDTDTEMLFMERLKSAKLVEAIANSISLFWKIIQINIVSLGQDYFLFFFKWTYRGNGSNGFILERES